MTLLSVSFFRVVSRMLTGLRGTGAG